MLTAVAAAAIAAALAYHPVGDRPAPRGDRLLWAEVGAAVAHWNRVGDDVRVACPHGITLRVATDLDAAGEEWVEGRGEGCRAWLSAVTLGGDRQDLRESRFDWSGNQITIRNECADVTHEIGHAIGLVHVHDGGVMDPDTVTPTSECRRLAARIVAHAERSR